MPVTPTKTIESKQISTKSTYSRTFSSERTPSNKQTSIEAKLKIEILRRKKIEHELKKIQKMVF